MSGGVLAIYEALDSLGDISGVELTERASRTDTFAFDTHIVVLISKLSQELESDVRSQNSTQLFYSRVFKLIMQHNFFHTSILYTIAQHNFIL